MMSAFRIIFVKLFSEIGLYILFLVCRLPPKKKKGQPGRLNQRARERN